MVTIITIIIRLPLHHHLLLQLKFNWALVWEETELRIIEVKMLPLVPLPHNNNNNNNSVNLPFLALVGVEFLSSNRATTTAFFQEREITTDEQRSIKRIGPFASCRDPATRSSPP